MSDGSSEVYDVNGKLLRLNDKSGLATTLNYSDGLLASVVDAFGRSLQISYSNGLISEIVDPAGQLVSYDYDGNGNLSQVIYQDGSARIHHYENATFPNYLTGITDELGDRFSTYGYDTTGRATSSQHSGGAGSVSIQYNPTNTIVTDTAGTVSTYTFAPGAFSTRRIASISRNGLTETYTFVPGDQQRRIFRRTDPKGIITEHAYDRDHLTSRIEAFGTARARTTSYGFGSMENDLPTLITEPGRTTSLSYDRGNVLQRTVTDTGTGTARVWNYTYSGSGQIQTADGPRTDVSDITTYAYYNCTTGYQCGQIQTITDALGHFTTFNTYNAHGQPLTITDPNSVVTTLTYDLRQRLTSRTIGGEQTVFEYWPTGLLKKVTLPDGSFLQYAYDAAHRLTGISDSEGNHVTYTLDAMGNRTAEDVFDPSNALTRTRTRMFNTLNQLWKELGAAGTTAVTTTFGYDNNGNQTTINAPLSRNTTQSHDELNRLTQVTGPLSTVAQYGYNALDQLISVTDPRNLQTTYQYNALGDLLAQASPDTGTTTLTYDAAGNTATKTDARGASIGQGIYTHDALNRVTQIQYPDHTVSYSYDACLNGIGRLCGMTDASGSTSYEYDAHGRVTRKQQVVNLGPGWGTRTKEVRYAYTNGRLTQLTLPEGHRVFYSYDVAGRVSAMSMDWVYNGMVMGTFPLLSNVLYDPFGGVRGWTWANGTLAVREYDQDGRTTVIDSAGQSTLTYDDANRITQIATDGSAPPWSYGYDALDRLTGATRTGLSRTYGYDANGNRLSLAGTQSASYSYSSPLTSNRLAGVSGSSSRTYSYDAAGNVTGDGLTTFSYDGAGRLQGAGNSFTLSFSYNGLGQRVLKMPSPGIEDSYLYDEAGHLLEKCSTWVGDRCNSVYSQQFIWLGDIPVVAILSALGYTEEGEVGGVVTGRFNIHTDHLNTPRRLTNSDTNQLEWRWDSDPFGVGVADGQAAGGWHYYDFDLRFPGQVYDWETGLHYNYFRDYDPVTGRYPQSDPIGLVGGLNTYAYVEGNPTQLVDPFGLEAVAEMSRLGWGLPAPPPKPYPILRDTYREMLDKNVPGTDQFFHCLGTCRAKKNGSTDRDIRSYTNSKEYLRDYPLGRTGLYGSGRRMSHDEMIDDINRDQRANEQGLSCPTDVPCNQQCSPLLDKLPPRYRPFMHQYRAVW